MHKIAEKEFTLEDFSTEHLFTPYSLYFNDDIIILNECREKYLETKDKKYWWQMIQLLGSNYNQTRNIMMNYEVLSNIYKSRKNHKLDEWRKFCKWIETLPYSELIVDDPNFLKKNFNIPEETIDKFNAIGNITTIDLKSIQEAINEYEKRDDK